jgi:predicted enzyme related to lactoylglutathione lyase
MLALADVAVVVSNANASAEWWKKNLGFAGFTVGGSGHARMVAPPGDKFVLHLCEGFAPLEPGDTGIAFVTDEIDVVVARMVEGGVRFPVPLEPGSGGRMAKFADPDGNVFWLFNMPSRMVRETLASRAPAAPASARASRPRARTRPAGRSHRRRRSS